MTLQDELLVILNQIPAAIEKAFSEVMVLRHPGHGSQKVHGRRGGGGDSDAISEGKEIVRGLSGRFGMPDVEVIEGADGEDTVFAAATARDGKIQVNSQLINDPLTYDPKYNDAAPINAKEVIIHEYGHVTHLELKLNEKYVDLGLAKPSVLAEHGIEWGSSLTAKLERIAKGEGGKISDYATKNGEEYFAEAFVLYNRGKKWHEKINPDVLKVFQQLDSQRE